MAENSLDFGTGENNRQSFGTFRPFDALDLGQSDFQYIPIKEDEGMEGELSCRQRAE